MRPYYPAAHVRILTCTTKSSNGRWWEAGVFFLTRRDAFVKTNLRRHAMESLSEQTELGTLLYPGEGQAPAALDLDVHGENLGEAAANAFPSSQQLGLAEGSGLASDDGGSGLPGLPNPLGPGEGALDETGQLSEARSNLEESGGAALDVATQRSLLFSRIPQKQRHFCHVCNRECPSKHKLKRHLSTHSEERPFNCHLCGRSFKWTEYLAKHMRQQHKGAGV